MESVADSETHLMLAERFRYGDNEAIAKICKLCNGVGRMLQKPSEDIKVQTETILIPPPQSRTP
jgi:hypothetical protein